MSNPNKRVKKTKPITYDKDDKDDTENNKKKDTKSKKINIS